MGFDRSQIAFLSKSDGLVVTFESLYAVAAGVGFLLAMLAIHWRYAGVDGLQELRPPSSTPSKEWTNVFTLGAYGLAFLLVCYFVYVRMGGTLLMTMEHDSFIFYDAAHRIEANQVPHRDFHTPMGALCNYLPYWGLVLSGRYAGAMEYAGLLAAGFFVVVGAPMMARRFAPAASLPALLFLCLLAVVPLGIEESPEQISHAMFYNRFGWAGLTLTFLFFIEPRTFSKFSAWIDGACLAALLFFLLYLKITYFLVAAAFLPLLCFFSRYNRKVSLAAIACLAPAVGLMELRYGFNGPYLQDLWQTINASGANRGAIIPKLMHNLQDFALVALACCFAIPRIERKWAFVAFAGYVAIAGLAIIDQNTHAKGVICWLAILLAAHEIVRRSNLYDSPSTKRLATFACWGLIVLFVIQSVAFRLTSTAMIRSADTLIEADLPGGLDGMVFAEHLREKFLPPPAGTALKSESNATANGSDDLNLTYLDTVLAGVEVLQAAGVDGKSVTVFDYVNPFSFILGMKPGYRDHTCIHFGRTMSDDWHSPPEELLGSIDYVMIPKHPCAPPTSDFLRRTYGPYLEAHFRQVRETDSWELWEKIDVEEKDASSQ